MVVILKSAPKKFFIGLNLLRATVRNCYTDFEYFLNPLSSYV